jgi:hypothetical protein
MKMLLLGFIIGSVIAPISGDYISGALKELTGKNTKELGFQAGKYTREKLLGLPPINYEEKDNG